MFLLQQGVWKPLQRWSIDTELLNSLSLSLSLVVRAFPVVVLRFLCFLGTVLELHTWLIPIVGARDCDCNHQSCWFDSAKESSACILSEAKKDECTCWSKAKLIYLCTTMTNDWKTSCLCFLGYASSATILIIISSLLHLICNRGFLLFLVIMWFQISWNVQKLCTIEKNYYHHHIHHQIIRTWTLKELPWASKELPHCQIGRIFNLARKDCEIECLNCWQPDCEIECQNWYQFFNRCRTNWHPMLELRWKFSRVTLWEQDASSKWIRNFHFFAYILDASYILQLASSKVYKKIILLAV